MSNTPDINMTPPPVVDGSVTGAIPGLEDMDELARTDLIDPEDATQDALASWFAEQRKQQGLDALPDFASRNLPPPADTPSSPGTPSPAAEIPPPPPGLPAPSEYVVPLPDGTSLTLNTEQVHALLGLNEWASSLTDDQRRALNDVEEGRAAAIPVTEYQRYLAWQQSQTQLPPPSSGQSVQPSHLPAPTPVQQPSFNPDLSADPDLARYVQSLQASVADLTNKVTDLSQRPDPSSVVNQAFAHQNRVQRDTGIIIEVGNTFAAEHGLSPDELRTVKEQVRDSGLLGKYAREGQTPEQFAKAVQHALDDATWVDPTIRAKFIDAQVSAQLDKERAALTLTDTKKARASSLASAPSTAVTLPARDPNQPYTPQEMEAGIAQALREAILNGTADS